MLTVVQDSGLRDLVTLDQAKARVGVTGSAQDTAIGALITRASGLIADCCGWPIAPVRYTQRFRPVTNRDRWNLLLARRPVIVTPGPAGFAVSDGVTLTEGTDYELEHGSGLLWRVSGNSRISWPGTLIDVTYTAGYGLPSEDGDWDVTAPAALTETCLDLVASALTSQGRDGSIQTEVTEGVGRTTYFDRGGAAFALSDDMNQRLTRFKVRP